MQIYWGWVNFITITTEDLALVQGRHTYNSKNNTEIYRRYTLEYQNIGLKFKN